MKGKGVKSVRSSLVGDLYCHIVVETPINLTERQKELLAEFEPFHRFGPQPNATAEKFWERLKEAFD